ncbi:MAG: dihydroorotate dehydrogenase-like protein [Desulfobacteraceae bacterium]|nr:dihydroorotate dehydrogenase-like protein [Desulfobacteraceae bacterium]
MDLTTRYLGYTLSSPLMPGASPMADDLDTVRRLEDAGAAAIVMYSLFEEQIVAAQVRAVAEIDEPEYNYREALTYLARTEDMQLGPELYLGKLAEVKESVSIPVIGSLNGVSEGGWTEYAGLIEEAGADALELNMYFLAADAGETAAEIENRLLHVARSVKEEVTIPVAVKLSPFFTALPNFVSRLEETGVDGVILFNRFYQPDIAIEELEPVSRLRLSTSAELLLRLRWLALLSGRVRLSLGVTGGVHTATDAVKAIMAGAHAVQMVSALYQRKPEHLGTVKAELARWLEEHEYDSVEQMRGSMGIEHTPDTGALERANYIRVLQGGPA